MPKNRQPGYIATKDTLYYDAQCRFCVRTMQWISRFDWFRTIQWRAFKPPGEYPGGESLRGLDSAACLTVGDDKVYEGFYAFRRLAWRMPMLVPLAVLLSMPGMHIPGVEFYRWLSYRRRRRASWKC